MRKITMMDGRRYVAVGELRHEIARLRKDIPLFYKNFTESERAMVHLAYNDILRALYRDELRQAKTPDEVREICDMEGDYIVVRTEEGENETRFLSFCGYEDKEPNIQCTADGMTFSFRGVAEHIRDTLNAEPEKYGDGWMALDVSPWVRAESKNLLKAIFDEENIPSIGDDVAEAIRNYAED